ncbi:hypothetical protein Droror1_Dr00019903, partial [Drosera rotundifolia]
MLRVGCPIYADRFTASKERVDYARVLVEVDTRKLLVEEVAWKDVSGVERKQEVVHPKQCSKCSKWGHKTDSCYQLDKGGHKIFKEWRSKKQTAGVPKPVSPVSNQDPGVDVMIK